ncbi:alpha/beta fold hydrolase [bacterium]|nr:alpha/beta fold hydrolase [bacterium]
MFGNSTSTPRSSRLFMGMLLGFCMLFPCCSSRKSAEIQEGRLEIDGAEIYYKTMGRGTPTFILHGGPGDTHDTMLQLSKIADRYRLIFYDQRAAGRSTGDSDTASHTVAQFVNDLEQLRVQLAPGKINLIGGSWGAMLAMQYAMQYSDHINALVLMSSMGIRSEYFKYYQKNIENNRTPEDSLALVKIMRSDDFKNHVPQAMENFWRTYFRAYCCNPGFADSLHLWMRDDGYPIVPGKYAGLWAFFQDYDIQDDLKHITCPTLILHGDHDPTTTEWVRPIHEHITGSQFVMISNAGHWLWVEAPDQVIPLIRSFLKNH